jgi:hypothetical protein
MSSAPPQKHNCFRCTPHEAQAGQQGSEGTTDFESISSTYADGGEEVFLTSGYSAREIAQKHAREAGAIVYVNNVSRKIKRPDLTVSVAYAVAKRPVYTLFPPDSLHAKVYRRYWPPLE